MPNEDINLNLDFILPGEKAPADAVITPDEFVPPPIEEIDPDSIPAGTEIPDDNEDDDDDVDIDEDEDNPDHLAGADDDAVPEPTTDFPSPD